MTEDAHGFVRMQTGLVAARGRLADRRAAAENLLNVRLLLLSHAFNSLTQRLFVELRQRDHEVSVEFDINERVTAGAVSLYRPDLIIAPFLKRAIPEGDLASPYLPDRAPGHSRRPRAVGARLGSPRWRDPMGRHGTAGRGRDGRRARVGVA